MSQHIPHTMLYRARPSGEINEQAWRKPLDILSVPDSEIEAYRAKGWKTAADLHAPEEPKPPARRAAQPPKV